MGAVIPISEIFVGVQGEGLHRTPAVFVRVFGCNLRCGFTLREDGKSVCDTPYAVIEGDRTSLSPEDLVKAIKVHDIPHVIFTGGEPLLYQDALESVMLMLPLNYLIEVETNGTIVPSMLSKQLVDTFNISVKLKSSNQKKGYDDRRINRLALKEFPSKKSIFKFVVSKENDIEEIKDIALLNKSIPVYLMPMGHTRKILLNNIRTTIELCLKNNYGFSNRDHIIAFDDERGK